MKTFLIAVLCVIGLLGFVFVSYATSHATAAPSRSRVYNGHVFTNWPTPMPPSAYDVYLTAAPGNSVVQMFDSMFDSAKVIRTFPAGSTCAFVGGPWQTSESGITMSFYKLTCDNTSGYVNAKWVSR